jgi:hypothetical protein
VLADHASARECPLLLLLLRVQLATAWLLVRGVTVAVQFLESLLAFIGSALDLCCDGDLAPLAQCAIVLPSLADGDPDDLPGLVRDDELGFLRVALLLPAVGAALFFCGRSTGLSATSTTLTAHGVLPACHGFLPGK